MSDDRTIERSARAWLELGPTKAPDHAVEAALRTIETTSQERDLRIPWRLPKMNPMIRLGTIAIVALVAIGGALYMLRPAAQFGAQPTTSPPTALGDILFCSNRDTNGGTDEIYGMHPDGSDVRRLTNEVVAEDWMPVLSPDRTKIAFGSDRPSRDRQAIWVMNPDGSGQVQLTHNEFNSYRPTWSPDGTKIAFASDSDPGELFVMNADGSGQVRLTTGHVDRHPAWSPDGRRIAFQRGATDQVGEIYLMNADGTGQTQLTNDGGLNELVAWSPDGTRLAFDSNRAGNTDIFVVNADGTGERRLTTDPAKDGWPAWSPDGRQIAFTRDSTTSTSDIYVMNADGSGQVKITNGPGTNWCPSWR